MGDGLGGLCVRVGAYLRDTTVIIFAVGVDVLSVFATLQLSLIPRAHSKNRRKGPGIHALFAHALRVEGLQRKVTHTH